jgi:hypothetical protein
MGNAVPIVTVLLVRDKALLEDALRQINGEVVDAFDSQDNSRRFYVRVPERKACAYLVRPSGKPGTGKAFLQPMRAHHYEGENRRMYTTYVPVSP